MSAHSVRDVMERAVRRLAGAGVDGPRRSAEWLLCDVLATHRAGLYADASSEMAEEDIEKFESMLQRRLQNEPVQYIVGFTEFYGLRLVVTPDVLIPRPETEELVEAAMGCIDRKDAPRILDVGTGSGCIALALKQSRPDADVFACDISAGALAVAAGNAEDNGLDVAFIEADVLMRGVEANLPHQLDLLVSNPPYVAEHEASSLPPDVVNYEPRLALFALPDPVIHYRRLAALGRKLIAEGGWIALETHADHGSEVARILNRSHYADVALRKDLAGRNRIVVARLPVR